MAINIGSAPDSWGVWFPSDPQQTPWSRFLDEIAEAGYEWTELGPYGYLPTDQLHQRRAEGYTMLGYGSDYHLLVAAARAGVTAFKE